MTTALERSLLLCDRAAELLVGTDGADAVTAIRQRAEGPLRVAVAGRVKAGKSTLLNALIGERLAATDAGECTKIVTWFQDGPNYEVDAVLFDGTRAELAFRRVEGALVIDLGALDGDRIERIEVTWPSARLRDVTLIDTPGLASLDDRNSLRTREFLAMGEDRPSDADAVIYLMRHLHRADAEFLGAFLDRSVAASSPVNAVAVLARADEIGGCRLDAMTSAARIAARYQSEAVVRSLCTHVTPMAGLLAETGLTLREDEAASLRTLAGTDDDELDAMLLSVDAFCEPASSELTVETRRALLERLGMFGLRLVVEELRGRTGSATAAELSRVLTDVSGLDELRRLIDTRFLPRANTLKARSVIAALRQLARSLPPELTDRARALDAEVEELEANLPDFAELRLAHLVLSGTVTLTPEEEAEVERATTPGVTDDGRLNLSGATPDVRRQAALGAIERWRTRGSDPLNDTAMTEVCETLARMFEAIYASSA